MVESNYKSGSLATKVWILFPRFRKRRYPGSMNILMDIESDQDLEFYLGSSQTKRREDEKIENKRKNNREGIWERIGAKCIIMKKMKGRSSGFDIEDKGKIRNKIDLKNLNVRNQEIINAISRNRDEKGSGLM